MAPAHSPESARIRNLLLNHSALTGGVLAAMLVIAAPGPALAQTIDVPAGTTATLSGDIDGGPVVKTGDGTLILTGNNTYAEATEVQAGTLIVQSSTALGTTDTGTLVVVGATLALQGNIAIGTEALIVNGAGFGEAGGLRNISGNNSYAGSILLNAPDSNSIISDSGTLTLTGGISGADFTIGDTIGGTGNIVVSGGAINAGFLRKTGSGTLTLSGGSTVVLFNLNGGTIEAGHNSALGANALNMADGTTLRTTHANAAIANGIAITGAGTLDNSLAATFSGVISGGALTKTGTGTLTLSNANSYSSGTNINAGTIEISNNAALGSGQLNMANGTTFRTTNASAAVSNNIAITGTGTVDNALAATLSGVISGGTLTKTGAGTLTLSSANTYSSGTNLNAGTIEISNNAALGFGTLNMASGTTFRTTNAGAAVSNNIAITGTGTVDNANAATLSGVISGGTLTKTGLGTLTLSNANTYSGGTNLNGGTIEVSDNSALGTGNVSMTAFTTLSATAGVTAIANNIAVGNGSTLSAAGTTNFSGVISGGVPVTVSSTGNAIFSGSNTFSLDLNVLAGTLTARNANALGTTGGGTIVANGATLALENNIAIGAEAVTVSGTGVGGAGALRNVSGNNSISGVVTLAGGASNRINADSGTLTLGNAITGSGAPGQDLIVGGNGNVSATGTISALAQNLTKEGTGTLTLSGVNTYDAITNVNAGTLIVQSSTALGTTLAGTAVSNGATLALQNNVAIGNETLSLNGQGFGGGGALRNISGNNSYAGSIVTTNSSSNRISSDSGTLTLSGNFSGVVQSTFLVFSGAGNISLSGSINGNTDVVMKTGTGTLSLSNSNSHLIGTFLDAGTIEVSNNAALSFGTLNMENGTTFRTTHANAAIANSIAITGTAATVDNALAATLSGVISGGALTKTSAGTLTLTNANTYSGGTNLNAGTIRAEHNQALGTGSVTLQADTAIDTSAAVTQITNAFQLAGSSTFSVAGASTQFSGDISGTSALVKAGTGTMVLTGANSYSGGTTINAGTLRVGNGGTSGTLGSGAVANSGVLSFFRSDALSFSGNISGAGSVQKTGTGVLTLGGNNTFSGGLDVAQGTVAITGATALGGGNVDFTGTDSTLRADATLTASNNLRLRFFGAGQAPTIDTQANTLTLGGVISTSIENGFAVNQALSKTGSGTLVLNGTNTYSGGTNLNAGTLEAGNNAAIGTGALNMAAGTTFRTAAAANSIANTVALTGASGFDLGADTTFGGTISGAGAINKTGANALILNGTNTFSGGIAVNAGTLEAGNNAALGTGVVFLAAGTTLRTAAGATAITNAIELPGAATMNNAADAALGGVISGSGALTKTGAGILTLNGANTYSGGTALTAGMIRVGHNQALGTGAVTMTGGTTLGDSVAGVTLPNAIDLGGLAVVNVTTDLTLNGVVSNGNLSKTGVGRLVLGGSNTYAGPTFVVTGVVEVRHANALGTTVSGTNILSGAALEVSGGVTVGAEALDLVGTGQANGGALRNLSGNNSFAGPVVLNAASANTRINSDAGVLTLSGAITGGAANRQLTLGGAGQIVISGAIGANVGPVVKDGSGTVTLNGTNTYTGATTVNAGKLVVNGSIGASASLTIAAGAELGGNGTLPPLVINGVISPGNSVGVINATGGLTLAAGSTTRIEIEGAAIDRIIVTGATTLNGTLQLVAAGGTYVFSSPYTFLTSTGAITGRFAAVATEGSFGVGVTTNVEYGTNAVSVTLRPATLTGAVSGSSAAIGLTSPGNVSAVAGAMDRAVAGGADASTFFNIYNQPNAAALAAAVNTLSGEVHTSGPAMAFQSADQFLRGMIDPHAAGRGGAEPLTTGSAGVPGAATKGVALWGALLGQTGRAEGSAVAGSADRRISDGHMAFGGDLRLTDALTVGVAASGGQGTATLSGSLGSAKSGIAQVGSYALARFGAFSLAASGAYTILDMETTRAIPALGASAVRANYRVNSWSGRVEAMVAAFTQDRLTVSPFAAIQAHAVRLPAFIERNGTTGAAFGVASQARTAPTSRTELGARFDWALPAAGSQINLYARAGWAHYSARDARFSASLIGLAGSQFVVEGARQSRNAALLTLGADTRIQGALTIGARADAEISAQSRRFSAAARLNWAF